MISTREVLLWWTRKSREEKKSIMSAHKIKAILYSDIQKLYLERV